MLFPSRTSARSIEILALSGVLQHFYFFIFYYRQNIIWNLLSYGTLIAWTNPFWMLEDCPLTGRFRKVFGVARGLTGSSQPVTTGTPDFHLSSPWLFKFIYFSKSEKLHENWQPGYFQRPKDFSSLHFLMFTAGILYESAVLSNMSKRNVFWLPVGCCKLQMDCWFNLHASPNWEGIAGCFWYPFPAGINTSPT